MRRLSVNDVKRQAASLKGQRLETLYRKAGFDVMVETNGLSYTPESSGLSRIQPWNYIERMIERFNETNSFSPSDYLEIPTRNASYLLTVISKIK